MLWNTVTFGTRSWATSGNAVWPIEWWTSSRVEGRSTKADNGFDPLLEALTDVLRVDLRVVAERPQPTLQVEHLVGDRIPEAGARVELMDRAEAHRSTV